MRKVPNIIFGALVIGSLILISVLLFIGTSMGERAREIEQHTQTASPTRKEFRTLIIYEYDSISKQLPYELVIREKDSVIIYSYLDTADSTKNMSFRFLRHNGNIFSGPFEFEATKKDEFLTDFKFDQYDLINEIVDDPGVLLFNPTYGVLGFDNGWGKHFYFLTTENIDKIDLPVLYH